MAHNYYKTKPYKGYASQLEYHKSVELKLLVKSGKIKDFYEQFPINLIVNNHIVCKYIMDFVLVHNDGTIELLEMKGMATDVWKLKYKILKAMVAGKPDVKLTVQYQKKSRGSKVQKEPTPKPLPRNYKPQF